MMCLRRTQAALVALSLAVASCATAPPAGGAIQVLRFTTHHWPLAAGTDPGPGQGWGKKPLSGPEPLTTQCTASNDRGSWTFTTPGVVEVVSSAAPLRVVCRREGYREAVLELRCVTPLAAGAARGADAGMNFAVNAAAMVPGGVLLAVIAGAAAAGGIAASAGPGPGVCAYGAGGELQLWMEPGR